MFNVSIIIPVHNRQKFTLNVIKSIQAQKYTNYKIIIVDDGSTDGTSEEIKKRFPNVDIIYGDGNWWWTKSIVKGIEYSKIYKPNYILLLNDDLILDKCYLKCLVKYAETNPKVIQGSLGVDIDHRDSIVYPGDKFNRFTGLTSKCKSNNDYTKNNICLAGRGLWIPLCVLNDIKFDYHKFPQYAADYDFTLSANLFGYKLYLNDKAKVYYYLNETGYKQYFKQYSFYMLKRYLTDIKSTCCLKPRIQFCFKYCYYGFKYIAIIIHSSKCILGYFKRWIVYKYYHN